MIFSWRAWSLTRRNQRNPRANQHDARPTRGAHLLAQDVLGTQCADNVAERRCGNHKADGLPGKQNQQRIKGQCHQRRARPEPPIAYCPHQELKQSPRPQPRRLTGRLHSVGDGDLASGAAKNQDAKCKNDAHQAAASLGTAVVRGFVCPTSSTPTQIKTTPTQRRGDTDSCKKTTASNVSNAYPNAPAGMT